MLTLTEIVLVLINITSGASLISAYLRQERTDQLLQEILVELKKSNKR